MILASLLFGLFQSILFGEPNPITSFPNQVYYSVISDSSGSIWLGSDAGVFKFDGIHIRQLTPEHGLQGNEVINVSFIQKNQISASHFNSKLDVIPINQFDAPQPFTLPDSLSIKGFVTDWWMQADSMAIVTSEGQILLKKGGVWQEKNLISEEGLLNRISFIARFGNRWYVGTSGGLFTMDDSGSLKLNHPMSIVTRALKVNQTVFIVSVDGFYTLEKSILTKLVDFQKSDLNGKKIENVAQINDSTFVFGSIGDGIYLCRISNGELQIIDKQLEGKLISGLAYHPKSGLSVTTLQSGVFQVSLQEQIGKNTRIDFAKWGFKSLLRAEKQGNSWLLVDKREGIATLYLDDANQLIRKKIWFKSNTPILTTHSFGDKNYLVGLVNKNLLVDFSNLIQNVSVRDVDFSFTIKSVHQTHKNEWLIATATSFINAEFNGEYLIKKTMQAGRSSAIVQLGETWLVGRPSSLWAFHEKSGEFNLLSSKAVTFIKNIDENTAVIGTNGEGLFIAEHVDAEIKLTSIQLDSHLRGENWLNMFPLKSQTWMISGTGGIVLLEQNQSEFRSKAVSLKSASRVEKALDIRMADGRVSLLTEHQYFEIPESELFKPSEVSRPFLSAVWVEGAEQKNSTTVLLTASQKFVQLDFGFVDELNRASEIILEVFDENPLTNNETGNVVSNFSWSINLTNPGTHSFWFRTKNKWTQQRSSFIQVDVIKTGFWWQNLYVQILALLFVIMLSAWVFDRIRRQRIQKELQKLEEKNSLLQLKKLSITKLLTTHYLFNALTTIRSLAVSEDKNTVYEYITRFSKLIRALIDRALESEILIAEEIDWIRDYINLEQKAIGLELDIQLQTNIDVEQYVMPAFVLQPLVENALRYGNYESEAYIYLKIVKEESFIRFELQNPVNHQLSVPKNKTSKGLELTKERLQTWSLFYAHSSQFEFNLSENTWQVTFTIPMIEA
ncbi:hypothetical protein EP331_15210 [bacterium]|nr:MAG: hypothetical protein EP331_15210 [bacterium]